MQTIQWIGHVARMEQVQNFGGESSRETSAWKTEN